MNVNIRAIQISGHIKRANILSPVGFSLSNQSFTLINEELENKRNKHVAVRKKYITPRIQKTGIGTVMEKLMEIVLIASELVNMENMITEKIKNIVINDNNSKNNRAFLLILLFLSISTGLFFRSAIYSPRD
jgi:hypothetical protein